MRNSVELIRQAAALRSPEEALAHWELAGAAAAGPASAHWVSIAFEAARQKREAAPTPD